MRGLPRHRPPWVAQAGLFNALEPEAIAGLNGHDLARIGIAAGERIRVSTRRGSVELTARVDLTIAEGLVFIPSCYAEAPANRLTNPQLDPIGKIPEFKFCAAKVERVKTAG